jgi:lipid-binding SYLF domain-containing protein
MVDPKQPNRGIRTLVVGLAVTMGLALAASPARADDAQDAQNLVVRARMAVEGFAGDKDLEASYRELIRDAKGFVIYPEVLKAGFILGGSGGTGVLVAKDPATGAWRGPAFYTIGSASFGLLAGVQSAELLVVIRTERGLTTLLSSGAKLGADVSAAVGPKGAGVAAGNIIADLIVLTRSKGLYVGLSVEGSVVGVREALNHAYYGQAVTPTDILVRGTTTPPADAAPLVSAVEQLVTVK